jgi:hypothetical protein
MNSPVVTAEKYPRTFVFFNNLIGLYDEVAFADIFRRAALRSNGEVFELH